MVVCYNKSDQYISTTVTLFRHKGGNCSVSNLKAYLDRFYIKNLDAITLG